MVLTSDSESAVLLAWWIGIGSILFCLLLTLYTFLLRILFVYRNRRSANFRLEWEGLIAESLDQLPSKLPRIRERDAVSFLMLWNHLQESLRAESKEKLNELAREVDIDVIAINLLERGSLDERLLAVNTLGWLRHDTNWDNFVSIAHSEDAVYSLTAAKALVRIDAEKAMPKLLPLIVKREDWALSTVGGIFREAGADLISEPLGRAILLAPKTQTARLIRFLEIAHADVAVPTIKRVLKDTSDMEIITACLRVFQDTEDLETVRKFLKDERWQIRLQAAVCLGRLGTEEDVDVLAESTADPEWWTRYRAAQSLANLPSMNLERLSDIAERHPDESARNIIRQVIAEKQVAEN